MAQSKVLTYPVQKGASRWRPKMGWIGAVDTAELGAS